MCVCVRARALARSRARGETSPQEKRRDEPVMVVKGVKRGNRRDGRGREGRGCAEGGGGGEGRLSNVPVGQGAVGGRWARNGKGREEEGGT